MTQSTSNSVSIRLKSGGHSFSTTELDVVRGATLPVEVVTLTAKSTLVPVEFFDAEHAADYLAEVGMAPSINEVAVSTVPCNGIVAVMAINRHCYDELKASAPAGITFTTPLLDNETMSEGSILHLEHETLYVRIYSNGLRFAEAMECKNDADVLYYLASINEVYNIYNTRARAKGDTARLQRLCKKVFRELCE